MKIAQISPIWSSLPPKKYGGTELVVSNLTEGLVGRGHDVTLFATGDTITNAHLISVIDKGLIESGLTYTDFLNSLYHVLTAVEKSKEFDILHFHFTNTVDYITLGIIQKIPNAICTVHVPFPIDQDNNTRKKLWTDKFQNIPIVSISDNQRADYVLNFLKTVYNGIDVKQFPFAEISFSNNLMWLGSIAERKGTLEAIQVALRLNRKLVLAGALNKNLEKDIAYYKEFIEPTLENKLIDNLGEVDFESKVKALAQSKALLVPIRWEEPFGLVMVEAMACGTPVIAYARGAAPEIIVDGVTGFLVNETSDDVRGDWTVKETGIEGLARAINKIDALSEVEYSQMRKHCRERVAGKFDVEGMVSGYEEAYSEILNRIKIVHNE